MILYYIIDAIQFWFFILTDRCTYYSDRYVQMGSVYGRRAVSTGVIVNSAREKNVEKVYCKFGPCFVQVKII